MTRTRPSAGRTMATATLAVGAAVAVREAFSPRLPLTVWFGPVETPVRLGGAALTGAFICIVLASLRTPRELPARMRRIWIGLRTPVHGRFWLVGLAVVEEAVWRGCLFAVLATAFGIPVGMALSSIGFGVWHLHQGTKGVLANTINGLTFSTSYLVLGGLPAAILTHVAHNLVLAWMRVGHLSEGDRLALGRVR